MDLFDLAKRVKAGVKLLDRVLPSWRLTLRKHDDEFDLADPDCCILGTLEHHSKQMRLLHKKRVKGLLDEDGYNRAVERLNISCNGAKFGFDIESPTTANYDYDTLQALWRAEYLI